MTFIASQFLWVRNLGSLLRVSQGYNQVKLGWLLIRGWTGEENPLPCSLRLLVEFSCSCKTEGPCFLLAGGWKPLLAPRSFLLAIGPLTSSIQRQWVGQQGGILPSATQSVKEHPIPVTIFQWLEMNHKFCSYSEGITQGQEHRERRMIGCDPRVCPPPTQWINTRWVVQTTGATGAPKKHSSQQMCQLCRQKWPHHCWVCAIQSPGHSHF